MNTRVSRLLARVGTAVAGPRPAFTLIELLVAVGALAFVAVGVAAIFEATGRTVQAGKRVSAFSSYAALIEKQMRADFAAMTREGFLVISNEYADVNGDSQIDLPAVPGGSTPDGVPLYDGDPSPRLRRIDQIMFFAKGQFVSARESVHPSVVARADAARIYYGHGRRELRPTTFDATDPYYTPTLDDPNNDLTLTLGRDTANNPNRFASDWILLRQVTLLAPPQTVAPVFSPPRILAEGQFLPGNPPAYARDSDTQIGLQPAASSIFRVLAATFPAGPGSTLRDEVRPQFSSGLLDIATTDLAEIRAVVTTSDTGTRGAGVRPPNRNFYDQAMNSGPDGTNQGADGVYRIYPTQDTTLLARSQGWMDEALPTWSNDADTRKHVRIRCEPTPPNYVGALTDSPEPIGSWSTETQRALRRADQMMLTSSNFLPRCTEFIVEWSLGHTWPTDPAAFGYDPARAGELVWYGMERQANGVTVAQFYMYPLFPWNVQETVPFTLVNGTQAPVPYAVGGTANPVDLFHGQNFNIANQQGAPGTQLMSYFGYIDPTFNPDLNNNGTVTDPTDAASSTLPCPWPKLIRVTLSLADPSDPTIEQTFQFVFQVPAPSGS